MAMDPHPLRPLRTHLNAHYLHRRNPHTLVAAINTESKINRSLNNYRPSAVIASIYPKMNPDRRVCHSKEPGLYVRVVRQGNAYSR